VTARRRWGLPEQPTAGGESTACLAVTELEWTRRWDIYWFVLIHGHGARIAASDRSTATGHQRRDLLALAVWSSTEHCTIRISILCTWQSRFRAGFLQMFHGNSPKALHQSCSATYQLQFDYRDWTHLGTGSRFNSSPKLALLHWTSKLLIESAWQPIFRLNYLQYSLNNFAHSLKQSCSPMIGFQLWCDHLTWILTILKATQPQSWAYNPVFRLRLKRVKCGSFALKSKT
jgi:hypothetical protein